MEPWRAGRRRRRRAVFALALLAHAALVVVMLRTRLRHERPDDGPAVEATIVLRPPPPLPPHETVVLPEAAHATRQRSIPRPPDARAIEAPVPAPQPVAQAASTPAPAASAASAPLNLTLTRDQIKALIAQDGATLAQLGPHAAKGSPYDRLAGEGDGMAVIELPHGVTEVHLHGSCVRLIPTPRAQSDPFNHANERLTGPCTGNF